MTDAELARHLARQAGRALIALKAERVSTASPWELRDEGDRTAHRLIADELANHRPDDILFSEEGADDPSRLTGARTWIVDPLDGTHDYPFPDSAQWAVHIALVEGHRPQSVVAAAVSVPALDLIQSSDSVSLSATPDDRPQPLIVSSRSQPWLAAEVAETIGGQLVTCGSSGVKAMLVVDGTVDAYIHSSGLWEWDVCAPAAVAQAAGAIVTDLDGDPITYNKPHPVVAGLIVARPELADSIRHAVDRIAVV